jgi:glycosyl transferase, family 25
MGMLDYFDRLAIIHLPAREDRYRALRRELSRIGIDINGSKVNIPDPPMPKTSNGFTSRGVYGSYLSHLEIIEKAYRDGLDTVWVLEDDAIFSRRFDNEQMAIGQYLRVNPWDMLFIGHSGWNGLPDSSTGLLRFSGPFIWAHCYAVHRRIMPRLIEHLRKSIDRESGHPDGGKVYIDAAYFLFRQFNPDVISVITWPCLSVQKGSRSGLGTGNRFDKHPAISPIVHLARTLRDEGWRQGWLHKAGPQDVVDDNFELRSSPAQIWPTEAPAHVASAHVVGEKRSTKSRPINTC